MSPDVVFRLYEISRDLPYFWVDDVHVSGLMARKLGIRHIDFNIKLALGTEEIDGWLQNNGSSVPPLFGHPDSSVEMIVAMWSKAINYYNSKYKHLLGKEVEEAPSMPSKLDAN